MLQTTPVHGVAHTSTIGMPPMQLHPAEVRLVLMDKAAARSHIEESSLVGVTLGAVDGYVEGLTIVRCRNTTRYITFLEYVITKKNFLRLFSFQLY